MNTYERVRGIVANIMDCSEERISLETALKSDLGTDSLEDVEIVMALEQEFHMDLDEEIFNSPTIRQIVDYIEARQGDESSQDFAQTVSARG